jgi:chemotaxis protein CheX
MEDIAYPSIEVLEDLLVKAVDKVFSTMLKKSPVYKMRLSKEALKGNDSPFYKFGAKDPLVIGCIGFTGEANGVVYIYLEHKVALKITSMMTGMDERELLQEDDILKDVVGEISNMTVGSFKNGICDLGFNCRVTLPTVVRGNKLEVDSIPTADRNVFYFEFLGNPVIIDLFQQKG